MGFLFLPTENNQGELLSKQKVLGVTTPGTFLVLSVIFIYLNLYLLPVIFYQTLQRLLKSPGAQQRQSYLTGQSLYH